MSPAARRGGPRRLVELTVMSLDGVISSPERWSAPYWDGDHEEVTDTLMQAAGGLILGRATYEVLADYWPHAGGEVAERMNALPKYVASRTLTEVRWNATLLGDDVVTEVAALKEQGGGPLLKYGTDELDRTLVPAGLVDELHLLVYPVAVGTDPPGHGPGGCRRLSRAFDLTHLRLAGSRRFDSGVLHLTYTPVPTGP
jgi:dihydrofolate reductase